MTPIVVFGGYGVFGLEIARELARRGLSLSIVGRDHGQAEAAAQALGGTHRGMAGDVADPASCRDVLKGVVVAVNCAGPSDNLVEACLEQGCHYVDIADDRVHASRVRERGARYREAGRCAVYGCSSLPGLSGALVLVAARGLTTPPTEAHVRLFIGNDNPKGLGAIGSLARVLGRRVRSPQGILRGFRDREVVMLPAPFGRRAFYNFESAEYDLFPDLVGVQRVTVKVGFEKPAVNAALTALGRCGLRFGDTLAHLLAILGRALPRSGTSGGVVMTEVFGRDGAVRRAAAVADEQGQRMAALPCAAAAASLAAGLAASGAFTVYELLGAAALLDQVERAGFRVVTSSGSEWRGPGSSHV